MSKRRDTALGVAQEVQRGWGEATGSRQPELGFKGPWHRSQPPRGPPMGEPGGAGSELEDWARHFYKLEIPVLIWTGSGKFSAEVREVLGLHLRL